MSKSGGLFSPADQLAQVVGRELAEAFLEHRKLLKKPMTDYAAQLMAKRLRTMPDPVGSIEQSLRLGWLDVFAVREERQQISRTTVSPANLFSELGDFYRAQSEREGDNCGQASGLLRDFSVKPIN